MIATPATSSDPTKPTSSCSDQRRRRTVNPPLIGDVETCRAE
jgi:hypothetical protein